MKRLKTIAETASTVVVLVAAGMVIWKMGFGQPPAMRAAQPSSTEAATGTIAKEHLRNVMGDGPLAIIEFSDFQCPFCAKHSQQTLPDLKKTLVDSGKVRYAVVNLPLGMHQHAIAAAEAAECAAEQGKYWELHDVLFAHQDDLASISKHAQVAGLNQATFDRCLNADKALTRVQADQTEASRLKVNSTPTLFIGRVRQDGGVDLLRKINGAQNTEIFANEIAKLR